MYDLTDFTIEELRSFAGQCTEWSCIYHGHYNREIARRLAEKAA